MIEALNISIKVKISLLQAVEALRVARGRGSHITYTDWQQMAARLSALRASRSLPPGFIF
jgi:hypothetical protein